MAVRNFSLGISLMPVSTERLELRRLCDFGVNLSKYLLVKRVCILVINIAVS